MDKIDTLIEKLFLVENAISSRDFGESIESEKLDFIREARQMITDVCKGKEVEFLERYITKREKE